MRAEIPKATSQVVQDGDFVARVAGVLRLDLRKMKDCHRISVLLSPVDRAHTSAPFYIVVVGFLGLVVVLLLAVQE